MPTIGWLGANVLHSFRLTIDYPKHVSYWSAQSALDPHDLDQVGLTLTYKHGSYFVAGIATQDGKSTVENVQVGDKLLQIGDMPTSTSSWGSVFTAMHGRPGESRTLYLERNGKKFTSRATVTRF